MILLFIWLNSGIRIVVPAEIFDKSMRALLQADSIGNLRSYPKL